MSGLRSTKKAVCTTTLIVINVVIFLLLYLFGDTQNSWFMLKNGAMYPPLVIERNQYYRFVTSMFLHFGIDRLLNNMVMLGALGRNLEIEIGKIRFILIYFLSGIGGNLLSFFVSIVFHKNAISAGASGAIFGLMGAMLWGTINNKKRIGKIDLKGSWFFGIVFMIIWSIYSGFVSSGVDNAAHIGGLLSGFLVACFLWRNLNRKF